MVASATAVFEYSAQDRAAVTKRAPASAHIDELAVDIVGDYGPALRRYLSRWLRTPEDVEDLLQDVFIRVIHYHGLSTVKSTKAFVFIVASNLLKDRNRRAATQAAKYTTTIDNVELVAETSDPLRVLEAREDLDNLACVLGRLNPNTRKAFLLHRLDGLSHKEIALHMQVTTSMVEKHVMEALKQVRLAFAT